MPDFLIGLLCVLGGFGLIAIGLRLYIAHLSPYLSRDYGQD